MKGWSFMETTRRRRPATAAVVGYFAVAALLRLVVAMKLQPFIVYTALLGAAVLLAGLL